VALKDSQKRTIALGSAGIVGIIAAAVIYKSQPSPCDVTCPPGQVLDTKTCTCNVQGCQTCDCVNCPKSCQPGQCGCACDCDVCPEGCTQGFCCAAANKQSVSLNPGTTFQLSTVTVSGSGFPCNDVISGICVTANSILFSGTSDGNGNVVANFNTGLTGPGYYEVILTGKRGGSGSAGLTVI
jgi:hypothetical protein